MRERIVFTSVIRSQAHVTTVEIKVDSAATTPPALKVCVTHTA
jgi:hypothetical protein